MYKVKYRVRQLYLRTTTQSKIFLLLPGSLSKLRKVMLSLSGRARLAQERKRVNRTGKWDLLGRSRMCSTKQFAMSRLSSSNAARLMQIQAALPAIPERKKRPRGQDRPHYPSSVSDCARRSTKIFKRARMEQAWAASKRRSWTQTANQGWIKS